MPVSSNLSQQKGSLSTPAMLGIGIAVYVLSCVRAWHNITKTEVKEKGSAGPSPRKDT